MTQTCTVCRHPKLAEINQALIAGESLRGVMSRYVPLSKGSIERHKAEHLPRLLAKAHEAEEVSQADDLLREVKGLRSKAVSILLRAEREGDLRTALAGIREARACLELLAELEGELNRNPIVNVLISPQWVQVRAVLMDALQPYPIARVAVADRLLQLESVQAS